MDTTTGITPDPTPTFANATSGLSTALQAVDMTGASAFARYGDATAVVAPFLVELDVPLPEGVLPIEDQARTLRLVQARRRSFARFGEAWRILADR